MKQRTKIIVLLLFVLLQSTFGVAQIQKASGKVFRVENRTYISQNDKLYEIDEKVVLAKLRKGKVLLNTELENARNIAMDNYALSVPDSIDVEKYVTMLEKTGRFEFVEYNLIYSPCVTANDVYYYYQWHLSAINANAAWEITTGSPNVRVAVIDDGVELNHEDLYYGNDSYANLNVGYCVDYVSSTDHTPSTSHGTMVAGVIGAKTNNNHVGVAGIAGGYSCQGSTIISFRTDYSSSQIAGAIYDAVMNKGVKVINLSIGGGYSIVVSNALDYAYNNGVTVVCSSGNDSSSSISFPASHQYTIAVGCTNQSNEVASFSNYGSGLDLVAPGVGIWTTCKNVDGKYSNPSGTSLAAPQVAGVVALMLSVNPYLSPSQIKSKLTNACTKLSGYEYTSGWNSHVGYGLLNAFAAVIAALDPGIVGPQLITTSGTYYIDNLPSGVTVGWNLSDSYYNSQLQQNYPSLNQCTITNSPSHEMINGTLTATIYYNGHAVFTKSKTINSYRSFKGFYYRNGSSNPYPINLPGYLYTNKGGYIEVHSLNLIGATASYEGSVEPTSWNLDSTNGILTVNFPPSGGTVIFQISLGSEYYYLTMVSSDNQNMFSVIQNDHSLTISLMSDTTDVGWVNSKKNDSNLKTPWLLEIYNISTGRKVLNKKIREESCSIDKSILLSGMYVVNVTIGNNIISEKMVIE